MGSSLSAAVSDTHLRVEWLVKDRVGRGGPSGNFRGANPIPRCTLYQLPICGMLRGANPFLSIFVQHQGEGRDLAELDSMS